MRLTPAGTVAGGVTLYSSRPTSMLFAAFFVVAPDVVQPVPTADTDPPPPGGGGPMTTTEPASRVAAPSSSAQAETNNGTPSARTNAALRTFMGDLHGRDTPTQQTLRRS